MSVTDTLAVHAIQKELVVLAVGAVGIIVHFKYTTGILEGFLFSSAIYGQNKHLTLEGRYNLGAQKVSKPLKR